RAHGASSSAGRGRTGRGCLRGRSRGRGRAGGHRRVGDRAHPPAQGAAISGRGLGDRGPGLGRAALSRHAVTGYADLLLLAVLVLDLYVVYTSRLAACVRASALQGATLALLPVVHYLETPSAHLVHVLVMAASALAFKAIFIPRLLMRALRDAGVRRDVEPFVSLHLSVLLAGVLVGISFWLATVLALPVAGTTHLFVPTAFATFLIGFLVLVSRRKAIT